MAIAPTATIANIAGSIPGNEPIYKNIYVKSNISGDFIVMNPYLVDDLKKIGLWDTEMLNAIKYNDGSVANIPSIPVDLKQKYKETFEIDMRWLVRGAAYRGKWIDQSQSLNIFFSGTSGQELSELYVYAWEMGLKTTYYLRSLAASQVEKSTVGTAGTHLRKNTDDGIPKDVVQGILTPVSMNSAPVVNKIVAEQAPIPSPLATPSPITKEIIEAHKVEMTTPTITAMATKPRLHIAEDAICEACQ
jgi:ribonucleoside-diphosphate reductase alpha chain